MKTYIIGDVHGCSQELDGLLQKMSPTSDDQIILVGDDFDRGMGAAGVWDLIHNHRMIVLCGNHEIKMMQWMQGRREWLPKNYYFALNLLMDHGVTPLELLSWLEGLPLLFLPQNAPECIVTHAAVNPVDPLAESVSWNVYGTSPDRVPLKAGEKQTYFWDIYTGEKLVVYGHLVCPDNLPRIRRGLDGRVNSVGLDTAACHGGPLTGISVEDFRFYSYQSGVDWNTELGKITQGKVSAVRPELMAFVISQREVLKAKMGAEKLLETGTA